MNSAPLLRRLGALSSYLLTVPLLFAAEPKSVDERPVEDAKKVGLESKRNADLPTLWIIGDSTVRVSTKGQRGWGDELAPFFDLTKVNLVNRAIGGRSSRTFLTDGRWDAILKELRAGDVVLMQFGHNDAGPLNEPPPVTKDTRARGTIKGNGEETREIDNVLTGKHEIVHSFGWYLRHYINTAKEKGAIPIVCSPIPHKSWSSEGKINRASSGYGGWAREAATQGGALFIDLNEVIARGYERLGPSGVEPLFADKGTHTTVEGARFNARSVVSGFNGLGDKNPVAAFLSKEGRAEPAFANPPPAVVPAAPSGKVMDAIKVGIVADGKTLNTVSIQKAIDDCTASGGGTIRFPAGRYLTGTIQIKSNVTLRLDEGASLLGSTEVADYRNLDPFIDGSGNPLGHALIVALDAENVGIEGKGTVDGQSPALKKKQKSYTMRPFLLRWVRCTNVIVRDVHLTNPGAWTLNFFQTKGALIEGVTIRCRGLGMHNNDGINIDSSEDIRVQKCDVNSGDDALVIKATVGSPGTELEFAL